MGKELQGKEARVSFFIEGDESGFIYETAAIWFEGHWWLLPKAVEPPQPGQTTRALLIRPLGGLQGDQQSLQFGVPTGVPSAVLDGTQSPGWEVRWELFAHPQQTPLN